MEPKTASSLWVWLVVLFLLAGCSTVDRATGPRDEDWVLAVWACPPDPGGHFREDGEGPYPASWPVAAVLCSYSDRADERRFHGVMPDATLFLVASKDLDVDSPLDELHRTARFAYPCLVGAPSGVWLKLCAPYEHFVFVHESGGSVGPRVVVIEHRILFTLTDDDFQSHMFGIVFMGGSRIPPYYGDIDGDGRIELLVASEETNSSGAAGTPQTYRIVEWRDGQVQVTGTVGADDALNRFGARLTRLTAAPRE